MEFDDVIKLLELFANNWQYALLTVMFLALAVYVIAFLKALGEEHGKRLGNGRSAPDSGSDPKGEKDQVLPFSSRRPVTQAEGVAGNDGAFQNTKTALSQATHILNRVSPLIAIVGIVLSALGIFLSAQINPCLKPSSQMTISEKMQCDPNW